MFALQHVMIMFTATIAAPLIIGQTLNLSADLRGALLTGVLLGAGIGTLVSSLGLFGIGGRLPLLLGAYIVYVGPVTAIAKTERIGAATGAMLVGGIVLLVLSPLIGSLRRLFPPVVVGTLLVVTGLTILKLVINVGLARHQHTLLRKSHHRVLPAGFDHPDRRLQRLLQKDGQGPLRPDGTRLLLRRRGSDRDRGLSSRCNGRMVPDADGAALRNRLARARGRFDRADLPRRGGRSTR